MGDLVATTTTPTMRARRGTCASSRRSDRRTAPETAGTPTAGTTGAATRTGTATATANGNGNGNSRNATVYLGVVPKNSTDPAGAEVTEVASSSPAERAGLETGDVITAIDAGTVRNSSQLVQRVRAHESGDKVSVTYTRNGTSKTVSVTLGTRPQIGQIPAPDQTPQSQS